ncbi:polyisoprenoid-binding protein YceI [Paenalcaligenes hominis]|uniref:Polyisoprenoid-binding protein YceI n=1 Tax=Paenalcaligenes hominis TaxID=643674 RepID=A0ABX0WQE6_9BURK|nr:YceI family protein [Paenalcaligenes hominis]NJB64514.1 polyisoprenoid-binding protein YceI [Paenalcaligenes hominis]GGE67002.1 polyisoprenoid-binding protein [Paenalcaligenes hominis]
MKLRGLLAALCAVPLMASAATYTHIDSESSQIEFFYGQMGVNMEGIFSGIDGQIDFDSAQPEKASVSLRVKMDSVDTGSDEADEEVQKSEWFNVPEHPDATFVSKQIKQTGDNSFLVSGMLSIKGNEQTIEFPATVAEEDGRAIFTGSFDMLRGDYAIGEGAWSKFDIVANEVRIEFSIVATQ